MRETVVVAVKLPDVPVTLTVTVPVVAVLLAVSVKVLEVAVLLGLKDALTPLGRPEAVKLTLPVKPFCGVTDMALVPLAPCVTVRLVGEADSVKFGPAKGVLSDTLSKVAVARAGVLPLFTTKPT